MTTPATLPADSPDLLAALTELDGVAEATPAAAADAVRVELSGDRDEGAVVAAIDGPVHCLAGWLAATRPRTT